MTDEFTGFIPQRQDPEKPEESRRSRLERWLGIESETDSGGPEQSSMSVVKPIGDSASIAALESLTELSAMLAQAVDHDSLLGSILDAAISFRLADRGMIFLTDEGQLQTACKRLREGKQSFDEEDLRVSNSLVNRCLREQRTIELSESETTHSMARLSIVNAMSLPLKDRGETFGVLYLDSSAQADRAGRELRKLLEAFASLASICLVYQRRLKRGTERLDVLRRQHDQLLAAYRGLSDDNLVGESRAWRQVLVQVQTLKDYDDSVLILGESGSGKEEVAKALHHRGRRSEGDFVAVNCAAIPPTLLESELFGTLSGSFTGARDRPGLLEQANAGTLFLDEIGELPLELQAKLNRFLDSRRYNRIGARVDSSYSDARILAATNLDLTQGLEIGQFRQDLYHRLNGVVLRIPPLRERPEDIPVLIDHFLREEHRKKHPHVFSLTTRARSLLQSYDWPGNVRQLKTKIGALCTSSLPSGTITEELASVQLGVSQVPAMTPTSLKEAKRLAERDCLLRGLRRNSWDARATAKDLEISRQHVHNLVRVHRLERPATISTMPSRKKSMNDESSNSG